MLNMDRLVIVILFSAIAQPSLGDKTTIVIPSDTNSTQIGLLFIPGASIGADQYLKLGGKIQDDSQYSVWLATIGGWFGNIVNPVQTATLIKDAVDQLHASGLSTEAPIFIAAHSLGGVFLDMYVRAHPKIVSGIILFGSYINKSVKLKDYPVPVLTITGDQDGMCRLTRIAKDFEQLNGFNPRTPVVLVQGVNHSEVASGEMPSLVKINDLLADLNEDQAHTLLSKFTNSFLILNGPKSSQKSVQEATKILQTNYMKTADVVTPFLQALQFDTGVFPSWAQWTATVLSGIESTNPQMNINGKNVDDLTLMAFEPKLVKINNTMLNMTVPYHNDWPLNPMDISLVAQAPNQLLVKTISVEGYKEHFPNATYSDIPIHCNDSNYAGFQFTSVLVPSDYIKRYKSKGRQLQFLPDKVVKSEMEWLSTNVEWDLTQDKKATVTSVAYADSNMTMCKGLTMSKFMEWIYIDAFKKQ